MKYAAQITVTFEFDVPGDDPAESFLDRNVQTSGAAAEVISTAAKRVGEAVARYDNPKVELVGSAVDDAAVEA